MDTTRRLFTAGLAALSLGLGTAAARAAAPAPREVMGNWYRLTLELVRHTPTYSPPVASRSFAYLGVTAYLAVASSDPGLAPLAGQLNGLTAPPARVPGTEYDDTVVLQAAMSAAVEAFFSNTGPTGQRAMAAMARKLDARTAEGVAPGVVDQSRAFGQALAAHVLAWSADDGGAQIVNMGFPLDYTPKDGPAHWVPTSRIAQQQAPLLPGWGENRPFVLRDITSCDLPPPPEYSESPDSAFHAEAREVYEVSLALTPEQAAIARFWSDDPMLSPTPPGHWISIAWQILGQGNATAAEAADLMMRLGVAEADAFIACWRSKYQYDLLRPVTYIRRVIDKTWEPLLITPPFPEYPSGHSTLSGAAAEVLTAFFGENFAFEDTTHTADGLPGRHFADFRAAADEAGISRMYGGIHFRAAIDQGLAQGRCVGVQVNALRTRG